MNALTKFTFTAGAVVHELRVEVIDGKPWFLAKDACLGLGLGIQSNGKVMVNWPCRGLDADEKGSTLIATPGGAQFATTVSESGLYKLIMRSDKPAAKPFQDWVTKEVLPSIRKTGRFDLREAPSPAPQFPFKLTDYRAQFAEVAIERIAEGRSSLVFGERA